MLELKRGTKSVHDNLKSYTLPWSLLFEIFLSLGPAWLILNMKRQTSDSENSVRKKDSTAANPLFCCSVSSYIFCCFDEI